MERSKLTTAIGTPLNEEEALHAEGLEQELADQAGHGIEHILVAGSMGAMQLLTDATYRDLIRQAADLWRGKGEILVGAGDAGFARSRDRIAFLNGFDLDGVAVLAPYFWKFGQDDLITYYRALADESSAPLYLYDLPQVVGTKLEMETILTLAEHPNIAGAKVSCDFDFSRQLIDTIGEGFRVMVAQPNLSDLLFRHGVYDQLEGVWAITPGWIVALARACERGDWEAAASYQHKITALRNLLPKYGFGAFTDLMNARGISGCFTPRPFARLTKEQNEALLAEPIVEELLAGD